MREERKIRNKKDHLIPIIDSIENDRRGLATFEKCSLDVSLRSSMAIADVDVAV